MSPTFKKSKKERNRVKLPLLVYGTPLLTSVALSGSLFHAGLLLANALGILISLALVAYTAKQQTGLSRLFCSVATKERCDKVLTSKYATLTSKVSVSDICLLYFITQTLFVTICVPGLATQELYLILLITTAMPLLASLASLLVQAFLLKSWCRLCLAINVILWLQATIVLAHMRSYELPILTIFDTHTFYNNILLYVSCTMVGGTWILLKPFYIKSLKKQRLKSTLDQLKNDPIVFRALLAKSPSISTELVANDFFLGSDEAPSKIVVAADLHCNACAKEFQEVIKLFNSHPESIRLLFRFKISIESHSAKIREFTYLMTRFSELPSTQEKITLLSTWFTTFSLTDCKKRFGDFLHYVDPSALINTSCDWYVKAGMKKTPAVFVNGHSLPEPYSVADISHFLNNPTFEQPKKVLHDISVSL